MDAGVNPSIRPVVIGSPVPLSTTNPWIVASRGGAGSRAASRVAFAATSRDCTRWRKYAPWATAKRCFPGGGSSRYSPVAFVVVSFRYGTGFPWRWTSAPGTGSDVALSVTVPERAKSPGPADARGVGRTANAARNAAPRSTIAVRLPVVRAILAENAMFIPSRDSLGGKSWRRPGGRLLHERGIRLGIVIPYLDVPP